MIPVCIHGPAPNTMTSVLAILIVLALFGAFAYVFNIGGIRTRG